MSTITDSEKSRASKLSDFRELLQQLTLIVRVNQSISDVLTQMDDELYCLREDNKRLLAAHREADKQIKSLEKRYSEVLYKLSERSN